MPDTDNRHSRVQRSRQRREPRQLGTRASHAPENYLLDNLVEPAGRDLSWYSIRHGVATAWADEENIHDAREQLRHKNVETTIGYAHSGTENRHNSVNSKW